MHNSLVTMDGNGTLRTASELDRETIANLFIRAEVADEFNATLEKIFTVKVTDDPVEDNTAPTRFHSIHSPFPRIISGGKGR